MKKDVIVAKNAGFCFGVARATAAVEKAMAAAREGERIYTLGRLIHNDIYNERLRRGGVEVIGEGDIESLAATASEKSPVSVFVRAHGMTAATEAKLENCAKKNEHFRYVDCTCSYVKKIHKIATEQSEISRKAAAGEYEEKERMFLVLGSVTHPEVVGFFSRFDGEKYVFSSAAELEEALTSGKLQNVGKKTPVLVAQTTYNLEEWKNTKKILEKFHICSFIFDTICSVTESRQTEAADLARECDAVIVINWKGEWIGYDSITPDIKLERHSRIAARYFHKKTKCQGNIIRATAHICGLGYYIFEIDGQRIGDYLLAPAPTQYDKAVIYDSYDITSLLSKSKTPFEYDIDITVAGGYYFPMTQNYQTNVSSSLRIPSLLCASRTDRPRPDGS